METQINWEDFAKIDIRVGTIIDAQIFEKARNPAYKVWIDFGGEGIKKTSAQITNLYDLNELIGKQVLAVINFPPKQIADFMSECLLLGAVGENKDVTLISVDKPCENGLRIS
ncbi:tRNA-binding protein [Avrilella dinanensis]|uniref:tRNA-binding protein n=1 Tax=Avrilella dinanensis TaxID=2008672 RepID=A0A2M9R4T6_9FLAO|nr:tRNA-binding protein [Avrilella dinanensis]PJR03879.1 tRNA-binding protein [Avrilella dinanensis]